jgi:Rad3-related DNA helicase
MLLDMPTGSGKSYLTIMFINWYLHYINKHAKFDILTNSKILQQQYLNDFPFIKNYKGRANYLCDPYDTDCAKGHEICKTAGPHCKMECPYEYAKKEWQDATIGLTNFHLFNSLAIYVNHVLVEKNSNVLIIDESHDFESVFCDYISTALSVKSLKNYGFDLKELEDYDSTIIKIKSIHQYVGFIKNQFIKDISDKSKWLKQQLEKFSTTLKQKYSNYLVYCEAQLLKFDYFITEYEKKPTNWVLDISKLKSDKMYSGILLEAKPIWAYEYMENIIFSKYDHIIFMSGTILDKELFSYINGLKTDITKFYSIESQFDIKNRPIYYMKLGKMTLNEKEDTLKKQIVYIEKILKKHKNDKGIIHTTNYENSEYLQKNLFNKRLIFHDPDNREDMLNKHIMSVQPTVIVSPSMISGLDLKDDLSRFQIIQKIPYPYLGSNKIKARQKDKPEWYGWKTVVDLIQSYGRSIRTEDDSATTYILDSCFSDILKYNNDIIPRWISDAIKVLKV